MHAAFRPYVSAGMALVGASVIAVTPIAPQADIPFANPATRPTTLVAKVLTLSPSAAVVVEDAHQGSFCSNENTCVEVEYSPFWGGVPGQFPDGVRALDEAINDPSNAGPKIVYAHSSGGIVAAQWLEEHGDDYDARSNGPLSFVVMGNPTRAYGGANVPWGEVWPETDYQVIDVARQYDPAADFPDDL